VAHVEDELRVDPRDRFAADQIGGVAIQALMADSEVPEDRIEVGAVDGWLSLDGEVSAPVREQRGVRGCVRRPRSGDLEQRSGWADGTAGGCERAESRGD